MPLSVGLSLQPARDRAYSLPTLAHTGLAGSGAGDSPGPTSYLALGVLGLQMHIAAPSSVWRPELGCSYLYHIAVLAWHTVCRTCSPSMLSIYESLLH